MNAPTLFAIVIVLFVIVFAGIRLSMQSDVENNESEE